MEVSFTSGAVSLAGTLVGAGAEPARGLVVFAHGSGPLDRDENTPQLALNIFPDLAAALAEAGYASLRYDKRGIGASGGVFAEAGQQELLQDLSAAIAFARAQVQAPLILLGHSEGTALVAELAAREGAAGVILICPYLARGADVLTRQAADLDQKLRRLPGLRGWVARRFCDLFGWPSQQQGRLMQRVTASEAPVLLIKRQEVPAKWLREFMASDQRARHVSYRCPALVLAAEMDAQCPPEDAAAIAALGPDRVAETLDGLSHILRRTQMRDVSDYVRQVASPLDPSVAARILTWLEDTRPGA